MNIEEQYDCPCGESLQTRKHTLRTCPRYDAHRGALRRVSRSINLTIILGTCRGILALADFLKQSGAFTRNGQPRAVRALPQLEGDDEDDGEWTEEKTARRDGTTAAVIRSAGKRGGWEREREERRGADFYPAGLRRDL